MPLTFTVEPWAAFAAEAEMLGLWEHHWKEISQDSDIPLVPAHAEYQVLDAAGMLHVVTARTWDGTLAGYWVGIVKHHLHYATTLHAFCDVFWLAPEHRRGMEGYRLFQYVDATLRARGVKKVITACKVYFDVSRIFERLGYRLTEKTYTKRLED